jgi:N-acetylglucosamine transport system substrate-binding protein
MLVLTMALTLLAGCGGSGSSSAPAASSGSTAGSSSAPAEQTLKVAAIETAYGSDMWKEVCAAFEAANPALRLN